MVDKVKIFKEAMNEIWDSVPKLVINLGAALLIYLFGSKIFTPMGNALGLTFFTVSAASLVNFIVLFSMAILVLKSLKEIKDVSDALAKYIAVHIGDDVTEDEITHYKASIRSIIYVFSIALSMYFFLDIVRGINIVLAGIIYVLAVLVSIILLFRAVNSLDAEITKWAQQKAEKLGK